MRALISDAETKPKGFLLDAESMPFIDVSAAYALESLQSELAEKNIVLGIARAGWLFRTILERAGVTQKIGEENLFATVHMGARILRRDNQKAETSGAQSL